MNTLQQIQEGWRISYAAEFYLDGEGHCIVSMLKNGGFVSNVGKIYTDAITSYAGFEITGYKYAGELAGNEEPEQGAQFKRRGASGHLFYGEESQNSLSSMLLYDDDGIMELYDKSEIQPIF